VVLHVLEKHVYSHNTAFIFTAFTEVGATDWERAIHRVEKIEEKYPLNPYNIKEQILTKMCFEHETMD
jgi:hypothetical protein